MRAYLATLWVQKEALNFISSFYEHFSKMASKNSTTGSTQETDSFEDIFQWLFAEESTTPLESTEPKPEDSNHYQSGSNDDLSDEETEDLISRIEGYNGQQAPDSTDELDLDAYLEHILVGIHPALMRCLEWHPCLDRSTGSGASVWRTTACYNQRPSHRHLVGPCLAPRYAQPKYTTGRYSLAGRHHAYPFQHRIVHRRLRDGRIRCKSYSGASKF